MTYREELASLPLSERIASLIGAAKTDQEGLAGVLGTPRETVNRWLNHHARPGRENRRKLAEFASSVYQEQIGPDMFREYVTDRPTPVEAAAAQLEQTGRVLQTAAEALVELSGDLAPLPALVAEMQRLADELSRREAANGEPRESR